MNSAILRAVSGVISEGYKGGYYDSLALVVTDSHLEDYGVSSGKSGGDLHGETNLPALMRKAGTNDCRLIRTKGKFQGIICPFDGDMRAQSAKRSKFPYHNTVGFMSCISKSLFVRL